MKKSSLALMLAGTPPTYDQFTLHIYIYIYILLLGRVREAMKWLCI